MGLFALLTRGFSFYSGARQHRAHQLELAPFAPRRLENRRLLDASAAGLLLAPVADAASEFVQVGENLDAPQTQPQDSALVGTDEGNQPPANVEFALVATIDENQFAELELTFDDPDLFDTHTVEIDWGDGNITTIELDGGERFVGTSHQYLDDDPSVTSQDEYTITVTITDDDGGVVADTTTALVKNVAPSNIQFAPVAMIDENQFAQLELTFDDPGSLDTHTVEIDWGDGNTTTIELEGGERFVGTSHRYLDDDPSVTSQDEYTITATITDDDRGGAVGETSVLVKNVPPSNIQFAPVAMIDENQFAQLELTFDDPGTLDTHTVEIDWGDGNTTTIELDGGERFIGTSHQYLDDDPSITSQDEYTISVAITDDDGGLVADTTTVLVKNVAPSNIQFAPVAMIDENQFAQLELTFDDLGTLDTHTVEIDWGDGNTTTIELEGGERFVGTSHQYLDDDPSITPQDEYTITVTITDDDGGVVADTTTALVKNVAPSNIQFAPVAMIDENQFAQLELTFDDPGTLDTHTVQIDWGDGNTTTIELDGGERFVGTSHQYLDDDPSITSQDEYTITVTITDDDSGVAVGETSVLVKNVSPVVETLTVTPEVISEGNSVTISGAYSDVGTPDTHTATIRWGDGTVEEVDLVGEGGSGSFTISHFYADNDTPNPDDLAIDNLYTITLTLTDDDGGETTATIDAMVLNVSPDLEPIIAALDVNAQGETELTIRFTDPGADTLTVYVDWGDVRNPNDPSIPALEPFVIDLTGIEGPGTFTVTLPHVYDGPPNPLNPAADIEIFVFVADDDFDQPLGTVFENGQSQIRMVTISVPGIGPETGDFITPDQGARLLFAREIDSGLRISPSTFFEENVELSSLRSVVGELNVTTDQFLELRVINPLGQESEGYRLKAEVLKDLPGFFRKLPDNHYKLYLVRIETNTRRLVIEVFVRSNKVIDPGDDSEGARDRPPTDDAAQQPGDVRELETLLQELDVTPQEEVDNTEPSEPTGTPADDASSHLDFPASETELTEQVGENHSSSLKVPVAVGLAATASYKTWAERIDRAVAQASPQQWRRLRRRNPYRRKNP